MATILIVDDEESVRKVLEIQVRRLHHEPVPLENGKKAWSYLQKEPCDVIITDLKMPEMDGMELLQLIRKHKPHIPVIMITAHGTIDTAVEAMKLGAYDYITKPLEPTEFVKIIERAILSSQKMSQEFQRSRMFLRQEEKIIGTTEEMERVYSLIERVAGSNSNVLITGEAGTGKEVVVRLLHEKSERRLNPLVRAHLSACSEDQQLERLFGTKNKQGWFELAEQGSLFLDEVSALSLDVQVRLYDALTTGAYERGGETKQVQCRIIAGSDINLLEKIEQGGFRKDLFYCLNVVPIYLPPLRERTQDIEPLVDHFLKVFSKKFGKEIQGVEDDALFHLIQYPWPGNIRELENAIQYAVQVTDTPWIEKEHLPQNLFSSPISPSPWSSGYAESLRPKVNHLEKEAIEEALRSTQGDPLKASQKLGVSPSLLEEKMASLKIDLLPTYSVKK